MANDVTHRVTLRGSPQALETLASRFCARDENGFLLIDFNAVVPQPSVLKDASSSTEVHNGLVLLGRGELSDFGPATIEEMMNHSWVVEEGITSVDQLKARLLERSPDCIEKARHAIQVYEETGHTSWYGWQLANWGVKWGAYNAKPEEWADGSLSLTFDTAWSVPHPHLREDRGGVPGGFR